MPGKDAPPARTWRLRVRLRSLPRTLRGFVRHGWARFRALQPGQRTAFVYFACLLVPTGFDYLTRELPSQPFQPGEPFYSKIFKADYWYQTLVTVGAQAPRPDNVSLVTISNGIEPDTWLSADPCSHRPMIGRLVREIARHRPAAIIVDFWYRPRSLAKCGSQAPTQALQRGIAEASKDVWVVMARDSADSEELPTMCPEPFPLQPDVENVLVPSVDFKASAGGAGVYYGLSRFDLDTRRLPYGFWVYPDCASGKRRQDRFFMPTIAAVIGELKHRDFPERLKLPGSHPFTSFLPEQAFPAYSASSLLCTPGQKDGPGAQVCPGQAVLDRRLNELRNRIVIIGERYYGDMHKTPVGKMDGLALHANYIESILSRRYFAPANRLLQLMLVLLWFAVVEFIFKLERLSAEAALGLAISCTAILTLLFFSIIVVYWGIYFAIVPPTILAIAGKYLGRKVETYAKQRAAYAAQS